MRAHRDLLGTIAFLLSGALALALVGDAIYAALIAPHHYHFGSEAMVGQGGWKYRSGHHYVAHALLWAGGLIALGVAVRRAARH